MKRSGIILELNQKQAIVMTNEAEFIAIQREPGMFVGARVELNPPSLPGVVFTRHGAYVSLTAIAILIFAFFFTMKDYRQNNIYAYITVDINPSIEFAVNEKIQVIETRDLNKDARILTQGINYKNMPLEQALSNLVNQAEKNHFLDPGKGNYLLVSTVTLAKSGEKPDLLDKSIATVKEDLSSRKIQLHYIQATSDQRKAAISQHLSTGRYALSEYARQTGRGIELKTAKTKDIVTLLDQAGILEKEQKPKPTPRGNPQERNKKLETNNAAKRNLSPTLIGNPKGNDFYPSKKFKQEPKEQNKVWKDSKNIHSNNSNSRSNNNPGGGNSNSSGSKPNSGRNNNNSSKK